MAVTFITTKKAYMSSFKKTVFLEKKLCNRRCAVGGGPIT